MIHLVVTVLLIAKKRGLLYSHIFETTEIDGAMIPPSEFLLEGVNFWKDHLVGFFLNSKTSYVDVCNHGHSVWRLRGGIRVNYVDGMFYFKFTITEEWPRVLEADPPIINGKHFIITVWSPTVD